MNREHPEEKRKVEIVFSPALFPSYFEKQDCIVVVIDIFRATSVMCAALNSGVKGIIPVSTLEEATRYKEKGYLVGAERKAKIVEGFDFGNSPLRFKSDKYAGETIVLTTTNGTKAIEIAKGAHKLIIGAFTNLTAVCKLLEKENKDVLLLCAGWKDRFNLEDTLFAGEVAKRITKNRIFSDLSDSTLAAMNMYNPGHITMEKFLENSSHRRRLSALDLEEDIQYCLTIDQTDIVPVLKDGTLIPHQ